MNGTARHRWRGLSVGIAAVLLTVGTLAALLGSDHSSIIVQVAEESADAPLQRWWAASHGDIEALRVAIDDAQQGLAVHDDATVASACQAMHDAGELKLGARLPAPEPALTSALRGAIEDAHAGAHLCLAAVAGSLNNYAGEFRSDMEQAERQLQVAQDLVDKRLTES